MKWVLLAVAIIVGGTFWYYVLSKVQMWGWMTAIKQFKQKEGQKDGKAKEE